MKFNIKRFGISLLSLCLTTVSVVSCGDGDDGSGKPSVTHVIEADQMSFAALPTGSEVTINVTSSGDYVVVVPVADRPWISVKSQSASQVVLAVAPAESVNRRVSNIVLRLVDYNKSFQITLAQQGVPDDPSKSITANSPTDEILGDGGTVAVAVTANDIFEAMIPVMDASWLSVESQDDASITFKAAANTRNTPRSSTVSLRLKVYTQRNCTVTITQAAGSNAYILQSAMNVDDQTLLGITDASTIDTYMKKFGWDYSENPNASPLDHPAGVHALVVYDEVLKQNVFRFNIHANSGALDGDRGPSTGGDRQRNEMKSRTSADWYKMNGNYDEWQLLEWKMMIPRGFRPSGSFTHLHQLKGQEGSFIGSPVVTISLRSGNDGTNRRVQIIHTAEGSGRVSLGTVVDNIPLSDFENEWVQIEEEVHFHKSGTLRMKITRIKDGKVLIDYANEGGIDMWRQGATNIRNKFGIYRSYGSVMENPMSRPLNGIKDESLFLGDFKAYKRNINPNPGPVTD